MSKETAARIAVRDNLIKLVEANQAFRASVEADRELPVWIMPEDGEEQTDSYDARFVAAHTSTRLTYIDQQNKQETARMTGLVGVSADTITKGMALNDSRTAFKKAMSAYRKLFGDDIEAIEQTSEAIRESLLGGLQISHLHFVQCYRQLKLFPVAPKRVGFSWAASHSGTVRLTAKEAVDHFQKKYMTSAAINQDIELLQRMSASEEVVIKRILAPHLRANITWHNDIKALRLSDPILKKQYPAQINTPLPVFIQLEKGQPLPEFNRIRPFDPMAKQERLQRSDACLVKISENPFSRIYRKVETAEA